MKSLVFRVRKKPVTNMSFALIFTSKISSQWEKSKTLDINSAQLGLATGISSVVVTDSSSRQDNVWIDR